MTPVLQMIYMYYKWHIFKHFKHIFTNRWRLKYILFLHLICPKWSMWLWTSLSNKSGSSMQSCSVRLTPNFDFNSRPTQSWSTPPTHWHVFYCVCQTPSLSSVFSTIELDHLKGACTRICICRTANKNACTLIGLNLPSQTRTSKAWKLKKRCRSLIFSRATCITICWKVIMEFWNIFAQWR